MKCVIVTVLKEVSCHPPVVLKIISSAQLLSAIRGVLSIALFNKDDVNYGNTTENEDLTIAVIIAI